MAEALVLTRPAAQAAAWQQALQAAGVPLERFPLIATEAVSEGQRQARELLGQARDGDWVFFTSPAAVTALFDGTQLAWPAGLHATCVGPGTAQALRDAGVPPALLLSAPLDADQFDSERLWPLLAAAGPWPGRRLFWLRGDGGRTWLIERLREAGATVQEVAIYRRSVPAVDALARRHLNELLGRRLLWLFSSSEAIDNLRALAPATDWRRLEAIATHPRIADHAAQFGMTAAVVSPQPEAVARAWAAWSDRAPS